MGSTTDLPGVAARVPGDVPAGVPVGASSEVPAAAPAVPSVVAHRGDSRRFRENTLAAVASAVDVGADRVEIDVRTTRDGVSVVLHDSTLLRLWGRPARVADLDWAEVAEFGYADLRIPRVEEVADALAGTGVGLLVDATDAADATTAWHALRAWRDGRAAGAAGAAPAPDVAWCGATAAITAVRDLDGNAVLHLATETGYADPQLTAGLRPTYLNMEATLLSPAAVAAAHDAGLLVSAWTVDEPGDLAAVAALGVDSITTNRPGLLRRVLAAGVPASPAASASAGPAGPSTVSADEFGLAFRVAADLGAWAAGYLRESVPERVETKAHAADLVTEVDRAVERRVREVIAAALPGHVVVGEEEGGTARPGVPTWYVDPVDGTTNYAHGLGWSSFSLALAVDREPLIGVVADPWRGEVLTARAGAGAFRDGLPLRAARGATTAAGGSTPGTGLAGEVVTTEWAAHIPFPGQLEALDRLAREHVTARIMGSGTLSCAAVATGRAVGCLIGDFHPEDHLAATLIAREAGAVVLTEDGHESAWPAGGFLVADARRAAALFAAWRGPKR